MKYRDLKNERDAAVARALEAERLSMKSEFDRVTAEFEREKARLVAQLGEASRLAYRNGFNAGIDAMADDVTECLRRRARLVPPSLKVPLAPTSEPKPLEPMLVGETREDRVHAWLWWGDGKDSVVWDVQTYCAEAIARTVEEAFRALFGSASSNSAATTGSRFDTGQGASAGRSRGASITTKEGP